MAPNEAALKKLTKEEIIKPTPHSQDLKSIKKDLSELRENFSKLKSNLAVTKQVINDV